MAKTRAAKAFYSYGLRRGNSIVPGDASGSTPPYPRRPHRPRHRVQPPHFRPPPNRPLPTPPPPPPRRPPTPARAPTPQPGPAGGADCDRAPAPRRVAEPARNVVPRLGHDDGVAGGAEQANGLHGRWNRPHESVVDRHGHTGDTGTAAAQFQRP